MATIDNAPLQRILTEPEAATWLKIKIYTLRKWRRQGCGPPYSRCGGRLIRYTAEDLADWVGNHTFTSTAHEFRKKTG
jgi:predicted site-specific integrase-resolvase